MQKDTETKDSKASENSTPLSRTFVFSFSFFKQYTNQAQRNYKDEIKTLGSFNTIEGFWSYYRHMVRPDKLPSGCEINLFQEGIQPMWEDEANKGGARFILRIKPNYANKFWEELLIGYIGEQCDDNDDICGLVLSIKNTEIQIGVWTKALEEKTKASITNWILKTLGLSSAAEICLRNHPRKDEQSNQTQKTYHKRIDDYKPKAEK